MAPRRRAGIARQQGIIGWHDLRHYAERHSFASHLVMRGVSLKAVQELFGHATIDVTMRYAHLSPDVKREAVRLLETPARQLDVNGRAANEKTQRALDVT